MEEDDRLDVNDVEDEENEESYDEMDIAALEAKLLRAKAKVKVNKVRISAVFLPALTTPFIA